MADHANRAISPVVGTITTEFSLRFHSICFDKTSARGPGGCLSAEPRTGGLSPTTKMPPSFSEFVASSRQLLLSAMRAVPAAARPPLVLVTGNEAADLDSIASALSLAYLRASLSTRNGDPRAFVPFVNIPRSDLPLRPDAFKSLGRAFPDLPTILDGMVFSSDLEPATLSPSPEFVLTDHNVIAGNLAAISDAPRVIEIADHHADQGKHPEADPRRIELSCGSATSLVVEKYIEAFPVPSSSELDDPPLWNLMLSAILVDTINLDPALGRCFPVDIVAVDYLYKQLKIPDEERPKHQKELFDALQAAKFDVSEMSTRDLLRKDYKPLESQLGTIGLSTVTWHLDGFLSRGAKDVLDAISSWMAENSLGLCVIMTAYEYSAPRGFERELMLVWRNDDEGMAGLVGMLEGNKVVGLNVRSVQGLSDTMSSAGFTLAVRTYTMNEGISRKKLMPVLDEILASGAGKL